MATEDPLSRRLADVLSIDAPIMQSGMAGVAGPELVAAGLNAPALNVVSGPESAIKDLETRLSERNVGCRLLATSHAFHSPMMDGALEPFREALAAVDLRRPTRRWISSAKPRIPCG